MIVQVRCRQCGVKVMHDPFSLRSCNCDPDSSSWVALDKDCKLIKGSGSNIEILEEK